MSNVKQSKRVWVVLLWVLPLALIIVGAIDALRNRKLSAVPRPTPGDFTAKLVNNAFFKSLNLPKLATDGMPEGGSPKLNALFMWVRSDATNYPGKSYHKLDYSVIIGAGNPSEDAGEPLLMTLGERNVPMTLILGQRFSESKEAFVVGTYRGGTDVLYKECVLSWMQNSNSWRAIKTLTPGPDRIRD